MKPILGISLTSSGLSGAEANICRTEEACMEIVGSKDAMRVA